MADREFKRHLVSLQLDALDKQLDLPNLCRMAFVVQDISGVGVTRRSATLVEKELPVLHNRGLLAIEY